jgi:glutamyl-Q tRNA(Asp) synthetase
MVKRIGGRWLLRIEDLDLPRVVPGIADDMLRTLEALGFRWDGTVVYQSRRQDAYKAALDRLIEQRIAYPCGCSRAEIALIASAPHGEEGMVYPGSCREGLPSDKTERAVRVKVYNDVIAFDDCVMGRYSQSLSPSCGDFVVQRADGPYAYHLAVVVDDEASGVTQVVRGADLLSSTPRQIYLQKILGYPTPDYCHLPLVANGDGSKLSKRDNAVSLTIGLDIDRTGRGLLIDALRFLGQSPPAMLRDAACREILDWSAACFDPATIPRNSAPVNLPQP